MKLATLADGSRDGSLVIVSRDGTSCVSAADIAPTLQAALDQWDRVQPRLRARYDMLNSGAQQDIRPVDPTALHSPLPRAYEWIDGSAYINHIVLVRKARGAEPPATLKTDPLVYQGGSGTFLKPTEDITFPTEAWGIDFESEVAVIVGDVPRGTTAAEAADYVRLVVLVNDVTLRNLIPEELAKGFGFFVSKPSTAFSPFAVTPDELGDAWRGGRVHLPLVTRYNGEVFGDPEAGPDMHFGFCELIEHVCKTRPLTAGTIIGSGTVSNEDRARGSSCLAERRMIEQIDEGAIKTPFMKFGDRVEIEMFGPDGASIFGKISQRVAQAPR
ncbi:MAG: fumarylacetoacetate hydrolase family protein [Myxococcales bacterium]|nr:fumarylacetoacetate hydrolase family protein [Myxococcales bacterium]MCB9519625.1 fumarylacetoacetate hydrolase family protein [Myxococcales bacterium]MCB9530651.1 fumarylacetoacetate hydrolase family protein [Myxococcales bacterium]